MRDVLVAITVVAALGGLGWKTAPAVRPPPPAGVEAPTVRDLALASLDDLTLREEAIRVLGFVGLDEDIPLLVQLVADPRWTTPAAHALIDLLGPDALPHLEPFLDNRWFAARDDLILALGHARDARSAEILVDLYTTSPEPRIFFTAAQSLEKRREPSAIEPFAATFRRDGQSADRLAAFPVESPARVVLRDAVRSGRQPHATWAMRALAAAGDPGVVPLLIEALDARDPKRRLAALAALGKVDDARAEPTLLAFEEKIDSGDEHVAWMRALWAAATPKTHSRALEVLSTRPAGLVRAAVERLPDDILRDMPVEFVDLARRRPGAVGDAIVEQLLNTEWQKVPAPVLEMARDRLGVHRGWAQKDGPTRILLQSGVPEDQVRVAAALNRAAESGDTLALTMFDTIPAFQRTEEHIEAVVLLLAHTSDLAVVDRAFAALKPHLDETRRAEVALALLDRIAVDSVMRRAMAIPSGEAHVTELARSGTRTEQIAAKAAAGEGGTQGARIAMMERLFDSTTDEPLETYDEQVRALRSGERDIQFQAARALAKSSEPGALDELHDAVMAGGERARAASDALTRDHPGRAATLKDLLYADPDPERRILALSMGWLEDPDMRFDALNDESAAVRQEAVDQIAEGGSSRAAASLREALDDEDVEVREAAARGLEKLGGRHAREEAERLEELLP